MSLPLLTIAIPTYNRATYLDINLNQLLLNINQLEDKNILEIIISNNASTDNTDLIVNKYIDKGLNINYYKNESNIGADSNFDVCLSKARGKYFWIFGDDELLFNNALKKIIAILNCNDVGCVYLKGIGYDESFDLSQFDVIPNEKIVIISSIEYIEKVNYYLTFCTGNIFNITCLPDNFDSKKHIGSNLNQVYWYLNVLNNSNQHIILNEKYFYVKNNNTGGYKLFQTFSTNFNEILKKNLGKKEIKLINNKLLSEFFPLFLNSSIIFKQEKVYWELFKNYFGYKLFWTKIIRVEIMKKLKVFVSNSLRSMIKQKIFIVFEKFLKSKQQTELNALKNNFKAVGSNFSLMQDYTVMNPQYMEIGSNFFAGNRFRIEAWDKYGKDNFLPSIKIGDGVIFNTDIHIGCINSIQIGDNCLFGSRIYITDHHHGESIVQMLKLAPKDRPLISKGPVVIKNNVWVGEGVAIMPNVTISENSIIATNAVVTKDVPANSVVAGVPAKVIKIIN